MDLRPGSHLGHYELVAPLGTGGMGEVYRARDTRLGRDVALKVPSAERLADATARARFAREMAVVAKLAHPNICTLLDVGAEGEQPYFVMELLGGETLATRLDRARGQGLPLEEALDIAAGVCEALAYAHRHGVVHRDVTPANVMLTSSGVKLLDFGVARLRDVDGAPSASDGTAAVSLVGTPAYMAPEQLDGRADQRADLFSFGAVLYEMLAGQRAFPGHTSSEVLGAVVRCAPPPVVDVRPAVPPVVARLVHRCLQKSADDRWQSAADLGEALRWARDPQVLPAASAKPVRHASARTWGFAAGVAALAAVLAALALGRPPAAGSQADFYVDDIPAPDGERIVPGQTAWSRDGRQVALVTQRLNGGEVDFKLWTREIGVVRDWRLVDGGGPEHVTYPSWSPDGQSLAYVRDHKVVRRSLSSPAPVVLADAPDGRGTAWLTNDAILYAPSPQADIWQVAAQGGTPAVFIRRQGGDLGVKYPVMLPDDQVLFWAQRATQPSSEIRVTRAATPGQARTIVQSPWAGAYTAGHLFYVRENLVVAQPVDAHTWTLRGRAEPVPVETGLGSNLGAPYVTGAGGSIAVDSVRREERVLTWVDRAGEPLGTFGEAASYRTMALSRTGERLLVERAAPGVDTASIWLLDLDSGASRRIVTEVGAMLPVWHPGEDRFAFRASLGPGGSGAILEHMLVGRTVRPLVEIPGLARPAAWLDEQRLLWFGSDSTGQFNGILVRTPGAGDRPYKTVRVGADVRAAVLRPGASAVAYTSNESGVFEVYVDTFPAPGREPWRVSSGGGSRPRWSRDGRDLFFVADGALHVVRVTGTGGGPAGTPRRLFAFEGADYEVHPDGRLLVQRQQRPESHYLRVFRNWSHRHPVTTE